jgi:hypothetical protein
MPLLNAIFAPRRPARGLLRAPYSLTFHNDIGDARFFAKPCAGQSLSIKKSHEICISH